MYLLQVAMIAVHGLYKAIEQCNRLLYYERYNCAVNGQLNYTLLHRPPIVDNGGLNKLALILIL
jgi:hypothetical protein